MQNFTSDKNYLFMISLLYKAKKIPAHFFFDETQNMSKENDESQKKTFIKKKKN